MLAVYVSQQLICSSSAGVGFLVIQIAMPAGTLM